MSDTPDPVRQTVTDEAAIAAWRRGRRIARGEILPTVVFAGGSLATFLILLGCVFGAVLLYYRGH